MDLAPKKKNIQTICSAFPHQARPNILPIKPLKISLFQPKKKKTSSNPKPNLPNPHLLPRSGGAAAATAAVATFRNFYSTTP